jgi:hypothetical protein
MSSARRFEIATRNDSLSSLCSIPGDTKPCLGGPTVTTTTCRRLTSDVQPCLRRVVRGAGDLQRRRIFDFPSERKIDAYVVSIDRNAARIYWIRAAVLTSRHPEAISI